MTNNRYKIKIHLRDMPTIKDDHVAYEAMKHLVNFTVQHKGFMEVEHNGPHLYGPAFTIGWKE